MNVLPDTVAHAMPEPGSDREATLKAVEGARRGQLSVEVRIGVGPTRGVISARVLGYAKRIADSLQLVEAITRRKLDRVVIFSSGPKVGLLNGVMNLGVSAPIQI